MKCYIVAYAEAITAGYEYDHHVFMNGVNAEAYFDKVIKERLEDGEYEEDEITEMKENSTVNYFEDIDGEWFVRIDEGTLENS